MQTTSLEDIREKTAQLSKFAKEMDGELASVEFDQSDRASIEATLQGIEEAVDEKSKSYERNDWIQKLGEQLKEQVRDSLLELKAETRIGG